MGGDKRPHTSKKIGIAEVFLDICAILAYNITMRNNVKQA